MPSGRTPLDEKSASCTSGDARRLLPSQPSSPKHSSSSNAAAAAPAPTQVRQPSSMASPPAGIKEATGQADEAIFANEVFFDKRDQSLYIPAYLAVVVKSLRNMKEEEETLDVLLTMVVRIQFKGIDDALRKECLDKILLRVNDVPKPEATDLDSRDTNINRKGDLTMITSRINLEKHLFTSSDKEKGYGQWGRFPFDHPEIFIKIEMSGHTINVPGSFEGFKVRYTLHEVIAKEDAYDRVRTMVSFKETTDALPAFELMLSGVGVKFPQSIRKKSKSWYYPAVVYRVPLLRHPFPVIRNMIIPLLITNFATISTFRMRVFPPPHEGFNERTATLVTILLALFAFLSAAHSALPDLPVNTFMDQVIFYSIIVTFFGLLDNMWAYETVAWAALTVKKGSMNAYARRRRRMVGREEFEAFEQNAVEPIGNIADVSIYEYDKRDERSFEFLNIFVENGLERTKLAQLHRGVRCAIFLGVISLTMYLIIKLILKVREYRNILLADELILNDGNTKPKYFATEEEAIAWEKQKQKRYGSGDKYDAKNFSVPFTYDSKDASGFVPFMDIVNSGGAKVHAIFESNREVRWYVTEGEKRTEYADGVQRKLEAAYRLLQKGGGPQFPTVAVDGGQVSLRKMQEISATGVTRPVIRE